MVFAFSVQPLCLRQRAMKLQIRAVTGQDSIHVPECDKNGMYRSYQCMESVCWCVDATGTELPNTKMAVVSGQTPVCRKYTQRSGHDTQVFVDLVLNAAYNIGTCPHKII